MASPVGQNDSHHRIRDKLGDAGREVICMTDDTRLERNSASKLLILGCALGLLGARLSLAQESIGDFEVPIVMQNPWGITQDRHGAIWFIDLEKLYFYDGYSYRSIEPSGDSLDLCTSWTKIRLTGGRHGVLCMTGYGDEVMLFFVDRNTSTQCRIPALAGGNASSTRITCVIEGSNGLFWIGTEGGRVLALNPQDCSFRLCPITYPAPVRALCEDLEDGIWAGTGGGLFSIGTSDVANIHPQPAILPRLPADADIAAIVYGRDGRLWFCLNNRQFGWIDPATHRYTFCKAIPAAGSPLQVRSASLDSAGNIWIAATGSGLLRWDPFQERWDEHLVSRVDPSGPIGETVLATMVDRTGILWAAGLSFGGIARYVPEKGVFRSLGATKRRSSALHGTVILAARIDHEGTLWMGTMNGGLEYRPRGSTDFRLLRHHPSDPRSLSHNQVTCICERRNGELWVGTLDGINVLDRTSLTFTHVRRRHSSGAPAGSDTITAIFEDSRGHIWIGHNAGSDQYDPRTGKSRPIVRWSPESVGKKGTVAVFLEDRRENVWVATAGRGVLRFNLAREDTAWYREDPGTPGSIPSNAVEALCEDPDGRLWLGTPAGLAEYDYHTDRFALHRIPMLKKGDPQRGMRTPVYAGVTGGIIADGDGNLWLSTNAGGVARFEIATKKQRAFAADEGIVVRNGRRHAFFQDRDGTIYFGGDGGMTWFHPNRVRDSRIPPTIIISRLTVDGKPVDLRMYSPHELRLDPQQNTLIFEFAALDYGAPDRNQFEYLLEGAGQGWVRAEGSRNVTFANLSPGEYQLRVRGSGREGVWSEEDATVRFTILSPWWRTPWAYTAYALLLLGIFYAAYRLRLREIRLRQEAEMGHFQTQHLTEVDRMKSRFFANISHEFRTPLTLISGPLSRMLAEENEEKKRQSLGMMHRNSQRLLRLINQLLDLSKLEAGAMTLRATRMNIVPLIEGISNSFESSAGLRGVSIEVVCEQEGIEVYCDRDMVEKILANLLSNAFKFTPEGGKVEVRVFTTSTHPPDTVHEAGWVTIAVSDTGVGIPPDQLEKVFDRFYQVDASQTREHEGSGIGLALVKELVDLHHGTIQAQSEVGRGTTFTVNLPLGRNHLKDDELSNVPASPEPMPGNFDVTKDEMEVENQLGEQEAVVTTGEGAIVLIIEDNADVRAYLKDFLASAYRVMEACDGEEGISKALDSIPDLIISDVMMPRSDGYEVCRTLKRDEKTSHIPIILLTAKAATENKIEGLEIGADDYLIKPFEPKELLARVKNLIELRRRLRERFKASVPLRPGEIAVTSTDDAFLQRAKAIVERQMEDEKFCVEELATELFMSRSQVHRKLTALTNLSAGDFIRYLRLHRAMDLLRGGAGTISEIAYRVGFTDPSHFARSFRRQFGAPPGEFFRETGTTG